MKIGDKVRFLSEIGGGRVAGFQGKDIVLVEDEDGFEVPMRTADVVVIGEEDYETRHVVEVKHGKSKVEDTEKETEPADKPVTFKAPVEARRGGDKLSAYLKCVEELKAGNTEFKSAAAQTLEALRGYKMPELDYFMDRFLPAFSMTLDELQQAGER